MSAELAAEELLAAIRRHGRTIHIARPESEELRYLDFIGAEANVGGSQMTHILLRSTSGKSAVLEEFLHGTQFRLGIVERLGVLGAEVHVKDFMIRHQALLGLQAADVEALRRMRDIEQRNKG